MATILDRIAAYKREEVAAAKLRVSERELRTRISVADASAGLHWCTPCQDQGRPMGVDCGNQESKPIQGIDPARL